MHIYPNGHMSRAAGDQSYAPNTLDFILNAVKKSPPIRLEIVPAADIAEAWARWSGRDTRWFKAMSRFAALGGMVNYLDGMPGCSSSPCFVLYLPDGRKMPGGSRLKDIHAAIVAAEACDRR